MHFTKEEKEDVLDLCRRAIRTETFQEAMAGVIWASTSAGDLPDDLTDVLEEQISYCQYDHIDDFVDSINDRYFAYDYHTTLQSEGLRDKVQQGAMVTLKNVVTQVLFDHANVGRVQTYWEYEMMDEHWMRVADWRHEHLDDDLIRAIKEAPSYRYPLEDVDLPVVDVDDNVVVN